MKPNVLSADSSIKKIFSKIMFVLLIIFGISFKAFAFELSPAVATLESSGIKSTQIYLLTNTSRNPAAIQFSITTRQQRQNGLEIRHPANNLFKIHPAQVVIPAGGTQKIQLKWLGKKIVTREQAYRFIAEQLPINLSKKKGVNMNIVMKFEAAVYVNPSKSNMSKKSNNLTSAESNKNFTRSISQENNNSNKLKITVVQVVNTQKGKQLLLKVTNLSNGHVILDNVKVQLNSGVRVLKLAGKQLGNLSGQNLLGKTTRNFTMPIPTNFTQQQKWTGKFID